MTSLSELKQKAEELKKRSDAALQVITKAEAQRDMLHKRLMDEFKIKPDQIDITLESLESMINEKKKTVETALLKFEEKLTEVENVINE